MNFSFDLTKTEHCVTVSVGRRKQTYKPVVTWIRAWLLVSKAVWTRKTIRLTLEALEAAYVDKALET